MKSKIASAMVVLLAFGALAGCCRAAGELEEKAEQFVGSVPGNMFFLMPVKDLISALEAKDAKLVVLDIRPPAHYNNGHIKGALHIPLPTLVKNMKKLPADKTIAVVCAMDTNSAFAVAVLRMCGYDACIVDGGVPGWVKMGMPLEK